MTEAQMAWAEAEEIRLAQVEELLAEAKPCVKCSAPAPFPNEEGLCSYCEGLPLDRMQASMAGMGREYAEREDAA